MTTPKLTEAQRVGRLVPCREANFDPNGQRQGPAWFLRWDVSHEGGACAGCSDGRHSLHFSKSAAYRWAHERGITITDAGRDALRGGQ